MAEPGETEKTLPDKIVVVGDSATVTGFKLAGVVENYVLTGKEGEQKVVELLDKENIGIVIINERTLESFDWRLKRKLEGITKPVIIAIPDKFGAVESEESLKELVKRALGFELIK